MGRLDYRKLVAAVLWGVMSTWLLAMLTVLLSIICFGSFASVARTLMYARHWQAEYVAYGLAFTPSLIGGLVVSIRLALAQAEFSEKGGLIPPGRSAALCRQCGYDLTGNVTGVCSECGTPVGGRRI